MIIYYHSLSALRRLRLLCSAGGPTISEVDWGHPRGLVRFVSPRASRRILACTLHTHTRSNLGLPARCKDGWGLCCALHEQCLAPVGQLGSSCQERRCWELSNELLLLLLCPGLQPEATTQVVLVVVSALAAGAAGQHHHQQAVRRRNPTSGIPSVVAWTPSRTLPPGCSSGTRADRRSTTALTWATPGHTCPSM